jgi:hypothetical protein
MTVLLSEAVPIIENITNFGIAGIMGAMWLWERKTSRQHEEQLDEAHRRIVADRVQIDVLVDLVKRNTEALSRLTTLIEDPQTQQRGGKP